MGEEINIGQRIRKIREQKGLTLKQVSEVSGLSVAFISQVEREQADPSWASLRKITSALNIQLKDLFTEEARPYSFVKKGQGYHMETHNIGREFLASIEGASMEMILTKCAPHSNSGELSPHNGEEFIWVLKGSLKMFVDKTEQVLNTGDSMYFRANQSHSWANESDAPCEVLWITSPPIHS